MATRVRQTPIPHRAPSPATRRSGESGLEFVLRTLDRFPPDQQDQIIDAVLEHLERMRRRWVFSEAIREHTESIIG